MSKERSRRKFLQNVSGAAGCYSLLVPTASSRQRHPLIPETIPAPSSISSESDTHSAELVTQNGGMELASPGETYVISSKVEVRGSVSTDVSEVALYVRGEGEFQLLAVGGSAMISVNNDNTFEEGPVDLTEGTAPGNEFIAPTDDPEDERIERWPGKSLVIGVIDAEDANVSNSGFGSSQVDPRLSVSDFLSGTSSRHSWQLSGQSLTADFTSVIGNQIAVSDGNVDVVGTAPGAHDSGVLFVAMGPDSRIVTQQIPVERREFSAESIDISSLSLGELFLYIIALGIDDLAGDEAIPNQATADMDALEQYIRGLEEDSSSRSENAEAILAQTVEEVTTDDRMISQPVQLTEAQTRITSVHNPGQSTSNANDYIVEGGQPIVIEGITNLQPQNNALTIELREESERVMRTSTAEWDSNGQWSVELNSDGSEIDFGSYTVAASDGTNTATVEGEIVKDVITPTPSSTSTSTLTSSPTATREPTATTAAPLTEDGRNRGDGRTAESETGSDSNLTLPVAGVSLAAGVGVIWYWLRDGSGAAPDRTDGDELPPTRKTDDGDDRSELSTGTSDVNANSTTFETDKGNLTAGDTLQEGDSSAGREHPDRLESAEEKPSHGIPKHIPRAPDVTVDYDMLTNEEPIGGGGNADVTKAILSTPQGDVTLAIKRPRMKGTLHTDAVERILTEAETWDKLDSHDYIVDIVDYGSEPVPWIAMEYMNAGDLAERAGILNFDQALWTATAITKGVRHAHRRGVAHLDLKPSNVLFRSIEDAWDVPKVADWGLSKHLLDHSKSVEGLSSQYAAPEQFDDDYGKADDITDVYQLGAVLYELFTGRPPFEGVAPAKAMHKVLHEEPTPPNEVADLPEALDDVLLTALAKEKENRYDGVILLRDQLLQLSEK